MGLSINSPSFVNDALFDIFFLLELKILIVIFALSLTSTAAPYMSLDNLELVFNSIGIANQVTLVLLLLKRKPKTKLVQQSGGTNERFES
jgi:hypothetical protein